MSKRIQIWRLPLVNRPWIVELAEREPDEPVFKVMGDVIGFYDTHAEAISAAHDWINSNPGIVEPAFRPFKPIDPTIRRWWAYTLLRHMDKKAGIEP